MPHLKLFFIEVAEPNRQFRHYGPIPGDPFEKLKLMDLLREMSPTNRVLRIFSMIRSDDDKLRSSAFELIPELPGKQFRRTYDGLADLIRNTLKKSPQALSNEAGMTALKWLTEQDEAWHARRIERPDSDYSPGEASTDDPKIVWSEPNEVGLRLGYTPAPTRTSWFFGDVFEMELWIDNVGEKPVRFTSTPRPDEALTLLMKSAEDKEISPTVQRFSIKPFGNRYGLKPGQRIKAMTARFSIENDDGSAVDSGLGSMTQRFKLIPVNFTLCMKVEIPGVEQLGNDNIVIVPAAGEWIGTLTSKPIAVTVGEAPQGKRDSPREGKPDPAIPEATSMSGKMHSAFAVQTKDAVNFVLYSEDQLKSEILRTLADGVVKFQGPIHLVRKGKQIRTFDISYSSEKPDELLINEERHVLNHVIAKTENGALQMAGRLFVLVEDLAPLNTQRTLKLRSEKDFETIHRMAYRDLWLARHYRHNRKLDTMTGWILAWDDQHMIQHSDGAHVAQMRIFPDGRVVIADRRRGLLTLKLPKSELDGLLSELIEHPAAQRLPKPKPQTATPDGDGKIPIQLQLTALRGGLWDQASSRVTIREDGETFSLFYLSKSRDGRPQTGMSDEAWKEISKRLWELATRVRESVAKAE